MSALVPRMGGLIAVMSYLSLAQGKALLGNSVLYFSL
jgi:hypothetical protein